MLVALFFCHKDRQQALNLLRWITELGGVQRHELLLAYNMTVANAGTQVELLAEARKTFSNVIDLPPYDEDERGWPFSANHAWQMVARQIENPHPKALPSSQPWLWLEPDAVPLSPDWLDKIEAEYKRAGKPFMGMEVKESGSPHLSGVSVYPPSISGATTRLHTLDSQAFDIYFAPDFLPFAHFTNLIQHVYWATRNPEREAQFRTPEDFAQLHPEAVLFHRCKSGELVDYLRARRNGGAAAAGASVRLQSQGSQTVRQEAHNLPSAGSIPAPATSRMIYGYYAPVPEMESRDNLALVELWKEAWMKAGWTPVVLGEEDAAKSPLYRVAKRIFEGFPTVNPKAYEMACYLRAVAMSEIGGWMADFDVFPLLMPSDHLSDRISMFSGNERDPNIPCLVCATQDQYRDLVLFYMEQTPTGKHFSDMIACGLAGDRIQNFGGVKEYGEPGWEKGIAVHFSTHSMAPHGFIPKANFIPEILASLAPKLTMSFPLAETAKEPLTVPDHIAALVELSSADPFAKGRIVKLLKRAGFELMKKKPMKKKRQLAKA